MIEDVADDALSLLGLNGFFSFLLVLCIPIFLIGSCVKMFGVKAENTRVLVSSEAVALLKTKGEGYNAKNDSWGNAMDYVYQESKSLCVATVTSAGKDKKLGTPDDIIGRAEDVNKSRIAGQKTVEAGKWVGRKAIEFGKGIADGLSDSPKEKTND